MKRVIVFFFLLIGLTACSTSEPENLMVVEGEEADEVAEYISSYKEKMIQGVNNGNFNELENYLITNNSFYHSLRRYVTDSPNENRTKELVELEVQSVYEDELDGVYADVYEHVIITEHGKSKDIKRNSQFELTRGGDGSLRIVTIKELK